MTTTLEELTDAIEGSAAELRTAIAAAEDYWDAAVLPPEADEVNPRATGEPWTPQEAADHAIGALAFFAGMAAAGFDADIEAPAPVDVSSPASALASLDRSVATCHAALEAADADVLTRPTRLGDRQVNYAATRGQAISKDVAGAFWMVALHSADHAQQIAGGANRA
jgi:hypothetical protein